MSSSGTRSTRYMSCDSHMMRVGFVMCWSHDICDLLQTLIEKRIGPWINKKITEYIGEAEPVLTEFICNKVDKV